MPTIAITNRGLSPVSIGLGVFGKPAKSFDLALEIKKLRTRPNVPFRYGRAKCKSFGYGFGRKRNVSLPALLAIAESLANIIKKMDKTKKILEPDNEFTEVRWKIMGILKGKSYIFSERVLNGLLTEIKYRSNII